MRYERRYYAFITFIESLVLVLTCTSYLLLQFLRDAKRACEYAARLHEPKPQGCPSSRFSELAN